MSLIFLSEYTATVRKALYEWIRFLFHIITKPQTKVDYIFNYSTRRNGLFFIYHLNLPILNAVNIEYNL